MKTGNLIQNISTSQRLWNSKNPLDNTHNGYFEIHQTALILEIISSYKYNSIKILTNDGKIGWISAHGLQILQ
jgi:hypothetical protein